MSTSTVESSSVAPPDLPADPPTPAGEMTVIEPSSRWNPLNIRELWRSRELLYFLTWRDIKIRYKQTILGAAWAIIQPLATMVVFSLFLGKAAGVTSDLPYSYSLFVLAGLISWTFFANALIMAGQSIVGNQNLVTKVYFPRLLIPTAAICAGLVDFLITFGLMLVMMAIHGVWPSWGFLWLPLLIPLLILTASGVGILLSALTVAYRDFRFVVPFMVQLWMFATPAIYMQVGAANVGEAWQAWLPLNPMYGLIVNFRQALLGGPMDYYSLIVSGTVGVLLLVVGCYYFRKVERGFADII